MPTTTRSARKKRESSSEATPDGAFDSTGHTLVSSSSSLGSIQRMGFNGENGGKENRVATMRPGARPLSSHMIRALSGLYCHDCANQRTDGDQNENESHGGYERIHSTSSDVLTVLRDSVVSPLVLQPMMMESPNTVGTVEQIIGEYIASCKFYGCGDRVNAGVLTTFRFSLPALRVSGSFHDADMLALGEILLRHGNGALSYIKRLDFSIASREGKGKNGKRGFQSHGAFTLSKVLQTSQSIQEVFLQRNRIGPYGASAVFLGASTNPYLRVLSMRGCRAGERGAMAFAEHVCRSKVCEMKEVDLSANRIGFFGTKAVERALSQRNEDLDKFMTVDMEGNLIFQEVMNCVTHGLGILMAIVGSFLLSHRVKDKSIRNVMSCSIYSTSLLVLYTSSTLYHSFFSLRVTKYIFEVFDKCAIYILIAGSYTPFCIIGLAHDPKGVYLLSFIWVCSVCGILVEAFLPIWKYKVQFSLAMYLGTGWAALVCLPEIMSILPTTAINLLVLGGVSYTVGVPFFVRNNNLDHSVWHMFVLAASMFHWFCIYFYVADMD